MAGDRFTWNDQLVAIGASDRREILMEAKCAPCQLSILEDKAGENRAVIGTHHAIERGLAIS